MLRLLRFFNEYSRTYLGYAIKLEGELDGANTIFSIGIEKAGHTKNQLKLGDVISWEFLPVPDPDFEPTQYNKVSVQLE